MRMFLVFVLLFCAQTTIASEFLTPFTATYHVYAKGLHIGTGVRRLELLDNQEYMFRSESETTGLFSLFRKDKIVESSRFTVTNQQIQPLEYNYHHTGGKKERHQIILFHWDENIAIGIKQDEPWEIPLTLDVLDKMSYQLAVMQALKQENYTLSYKIADSGKIKQYDPRLAGNEILQTQLGDVEAVKFERISPNGERRTTLWCAPQFQFLPIKVEHDEKGDVLRFELISIEGLESKSVASDDAQ
ncbi:DUF3108 domain-containing protein [Candidatus Albibeggiatoa sp. nov. NOAA]|uniref:DUF3108 domain-containing protein n=1 Tax=Candidatus Albibeggiatoa sp. nov. NOAA TaxID=3162724 RepID=UPI0032FC0EAB|nr:DUF3108 domain-containing protein [Thiotrichaceae bacterium]